MGLTLAVTIEQGHRVSIEEKKGLSSSNLYPISSLSLNDCSLKDSTDSTLFTRGNASYHSQRTHVQKNQARPQIWHVCP
ncbi:ATV_HP_G0159060.mRNA.1.CDS.1 [Saccharomyces cerevisiae]|nr:ATV_HP_G0159060.mRNA.1.CDS.1 [Saccharomyces cerevisiae]CAI6938399.1 ATV_HP_G0159060.mRNA.1.CDS.1 [Saccharomyces cerevisiae]